MIETHNAGLGHVPLCHKMTPRAHRQGLAIRHRADNQFEVHEIRTD